MFYCINQNKKKEYQEIGCFYKVCVDMCREGAWPRVNVSGCVLSSMAEEFWGGGTYARLFAGVFFPPFYNALKIPQDGEEKWEEVEMFWVHLSFYLYLVGYRYTEIARKRFLTFCPL